MDQTSNFSPTPPHLHQVEFVDRSTDLKEEVTDYV